MLTISKPFCWTGADLPPEGVHREGTELLVATRRHCGRMARPACWAVGPCGDRLCRGLCETEPGPASTDRRAACEATGVVRISGCRWQDHQDDGAPSWVGCDLFRGQICLTHRACRRRREGPRSSPGERSCRPRPARTLCASPHRRQSST